MGVLDGICVEPVNGIKDSRANFTAYGSGTSRKRRTVEHEKLEGIVHQVRGKVLAIVFQMAAAVIIEQRLLMIGDTRAP